MPPKRSLSSVFVRFSALFHQLLYFKFPTPLYQYACPPSAVYFYQCRFSALFHQFTVLFPTLFISALATVTWLYALLAPSSVQVVAARSALPFAIANWQMDVKTRKKPAYHRRIDNRKNRNTLNIFLCLNLAWSKVVQEKRYLFTENWRKRV